MKIYTKIILDKNDKVLEEEYFQYNGSIARCGIHYDFKSTKSSKLMEKQAKREKKLAERKAKRLAKEGPKKEETKTPALDASKPITLDFLTNPDKE
jgi:hypothetical protein|tara:strand:- start:18 stop:305 length:288 start_codon:yes stop_codon:yes gene_type:complete